MIGICTSDHTRLGRNALYALTATSPFSASTNGTPCHRTLVSSVGLHAVESHLGAQQRRQDPPRDGIVVNDQSLDSRSFPVRHEWDKVNEGTSLQLDDRAVRGGLGMLETSCCTGPGVSSDDFVCGKGGLVDDVLRVEERAELVGDDADAGGSHGVEGEEGNDGRGESRVWRRSVDELEREGDTSSRSYSECTLKVSAVVGCQSRT